MAQKSTRNVWVFGERFSSPAKKEFEICRHSLPDPSCPRNTAEVLQDRFPRYIASQNLVRISTFLRDVLGNRFERLSKVTQPRQFGKICRKMEARPPKADFLQFGFPSRKIQGSPRGRGSFKKQKLC